MKEKILVPVKARQRFAELLHEHCNTEYDKKTGEELVVSTFAAVEIAFDEFLKEQEVSIDKLLPSEEEINSMSTAHKQYWYLHGDSKNIKAALMLIKDYIKNKLR